MQRRAYHYKFEKFDREFIALISAGLALNCCPLVIRFGHDYRQSEF